MVTGEPKWERLVEEEPSLPVRGVNSPVAPNRRVAMAPAEDFPDYYVVHYLRRTGPAAPWLANEEMYPTLEEARERMAKLVAEGDRSVRVKQRHWP